MTIPVMRRPPVLVMETDRDPVIAGGNQAGWVSGSPAGLAASASLICIFDLGPNWDQYVMLDVGVYPQAPSIGMKNIAIRGGDTAAYNDRRRANIATPSVLKLDAVYSTAPSANAAVSITVRPRGRYVFVNMDNSDAGAALGGQSLVTVIAYPS